MTLRSDRLLAIGGFAVLVSILLGLTLWVSLGRASGSSTQPFQLQGTHGEPVDQTIFQGQPSLVSFGYTHCPDVCPTTLFEMAGWLEALGPEGQDLQGLFITVDPERDTLDVLGPYVSAFSDRITGVTGESDEVRKVLNAWHVTGQPSAGETPDYSMMHTTSVLLVGRNGRLAGLLPYDTDNETALRKIRDTLL